MGRIKQLDQEEYTRHIRSLRAGDRNADETTLSVNPSLDQVAIRKETESKGGIEMENEIKGSFLYPAGGLLLLFAWFTWFLETPDPINWLQLVGWVIGAAGMLLIGLTLLTLRRRGQPEDGMDVARTLVLVETGIYALVRHPLYLGWILTYVAVMAIGQYCLTVLFGLLGIGCVILISRQEDRRLVERFGARYEAYLQAVPAINLLAGFVRWIRRRKEGSQQSTSETNEQSLETV